MNEECISRRGQEKRRMEAGICFAQREGVHRESYDQSMILFYLPFSVFFVFSVRFISIRFHPPFLLISA
jgi:hypothetical protein